MRMLAVAVALGLSAAPLSAQIAIDHENTPPGEHLHTYAGGANAVNWFGQVFAQSQNNIAGFGADLFLAAPGRILYELWSGDNNLLSGEHHVAADPASGWVDIFWDAIAVAPGTALAFLMNAPDSSVGWQAVQDYSFSTPGYEIARFGHDGPGWSTNIVEDMVYRTYYDVDFTVAPEPGAILLLAFGLLGVAAMRLRVRA